jgi:hypothetical protein
MNFMFELYNKLFKKLVLPGRWRVVLVGGGRRWERIREGEYGSNTVYTCMQMENDTC